MPIRASATLAILAVLACPSAASAQEPAGPGAPTGLDPLWITLAAITLILLAGRLGVFTRLRRAADRPDGTG